MPFLHGSGMLTERQLEVGAAQVRSAGSTAVIFIRLLSIPEVLPPTQLGGQCAEAARNAELICCMHAKNGNTGKLMGGIVILFCSF